MKTLTEQQAHVWSIAPISHNHIAQDRDGWWYSYTRIPLKGCVSYIGNTGVDIPHKQLFLGKINGWNWLDTLQSREEFEAMKTENNDNVIDEWKPEVGQKCESRSLFCDTFHPAIFHGKKQNGTGIFERLHDGVLYATTMSDCRPLQSKADKESDEQISLIDKAIPNPWNLSLGKGLYSKGIRAITPGKYVVTPLSDEQRQKIYEMPLQSNIRMIIDAVERELGIID